MALQSDGKIMAAGYSFAPGNNDFAVARYNTNGTLDPNFNATGKVTVDFGGIDYAHCVAVQNDGKIVVAGETAKSERHRFAIVRFESNGTLDTSFNKTGKLPIDLGDGDAEAQSVAVQADGKIVLVGSAGPSKELSLALARYNADGSLDASFGSGGKVTRTAIGASITNRNSLALQRNGKIVVAAYAINTNSRARDFAVGRYNANGSLDASLGDSGKVTTIVGNGDGSSDAVAVQDDGKIVAAESAFNGRDNDFVVVRYYVDGKLDTSFNGTGKVTTALGTTTIEEDAASEENNTGPSMATIDDPDGYTNVRDDDNKVIARVKAGERFILEQPQTEKRQCFVHLKSGITGWMDRSRVRLLPDEPLMKFNYDPSKNVWRKLQSEKVTESNEAAWQAKKHGVDYYKTLVKASEGDLRAIRRAFSLAQFMDGAAAEVYFEERGSFSTSWATRDSRSFCAASRSMIR